MWIHTVKSRTRVIYPLKELAHFWSKLLVDFLHVKNIDFIPLWRHIKTHAISRVYFNTVPPQYLHFTAMMNLGNRPNHAVER